MAIATLRSTAHVEPLMLAQYHIRSLGQPSKVSKAVVTFHFANEKTEADSGYVTCPEPPCGCSDSQEYHPTQGSAICLPGL